MCVLKWNVSGNFVLNRFCPKLFFLILSLICSVSLGFPIQKSHHNRQYNSSFSATVKTLSPYIKQQVKKYMWHPGCPVNPDDLVYVKLNYWGFDNKIHKGALIVHKKVAKDIVNIFGELFKQRFPIQKMQPSYLYQGSDLKAMMDNDTSAFICRALTLHPAKFSSHSYGMAIDINPLMNPYVKDNVIFPPKGKIYLNRNKPVNGMIIKGSEAYNAFIKNGWEWGGDWKNLKDYQHFEKLGFYSVFINN